MILAACARCRGYTSLASGEILIYPNWFDWEPIINIESGLAHVLPHLPAKMLQLGLTARDKFRK